MKIQQSRANRTHQWNRALAHCGVALAVAALALPAWGNVSGKAGYAGAPGDPPPEQTRTCAQCHVGGVFDGSVTIEVPPAVKPSSTTEIAVFYEGDSPSKWGFNLIAIDDATGEPVGQLVAGTGSKLMTSPPPPNGASWQYLSHTASGTTNLFQDTPGWEVQWQAPPESVPSVSFYLAFNAANGNFGSGGDTVLTEQVIVSVPEPGALGAGVIALLALAAVRTRRH